MKFDHASVFGSVLLTTWLSIITGCGNSTGSTVIAPTEVYQPTEQEQINEANFEAMRDQQ